MTTHLDWQEEVGPYEMCMLRKLVLHQSLSVLIELQLDAHTNYGKKSDSGRPGYYGSGGPGGPGGGGPGGPPSGFGRGPGQGGAPRGLGNVRGIDHSTFRLILFLSFGPVNS